MYKSIMKLLLIAALCVPWATQAQDCTQTITQSQPFFEDFEGVTGSSYSTAGSLPSCWNGYTSGSSANYSPHVVGSGTYWYTHSGSKALGFTCGSSATYGNTKIVMLPPVSVTLNQLEISFWMCTESSTNGTLTVGYVTSDDTSTFTAIQSFTASSATYHSGSGLQATAGAEYTVSLSTVPATATRLAFKWYYNASSFYSCFVDDVTVSYPPTCPRVDSLAVISSATQAVLSWTETGTATNWEVVVSDASTDVYSGIVSTNPVTIPNLDPNTEYTATVRAVCGTDDTSMSRSLQFRTSCLSIASDSLPWNYGFEDASGSGASSTFNSCLGRYRAGSTTLYPYASTTYSHNGSNYSLYMYSTSAIHSWLTLPPFEDDIDNLYLSFYVYKTSASYGKWMVGVMSDPNDISTFDTIASGQAVNTSTWELVEVPLSAYSGTGTFLTILCPKGSTNVTYIDDITVSMPPACPPPTDIAGSNASSNSVDVTWTSSANEYIVEYGRPGFTQGNGTIQLVSSNSVTLTDLTMGLTYGVYVTAICGNDTSSPAYGTVSTGCSLLTVNDLPYTEDFEWYGTGATQSINSCWTKGTNSATAYPYPYSTAGINSTRGLYFYSTRSSSATSTSYYSWAALPPLDDDVDMNDLMVSFKAKRYSSTSAAYHSMIAVGVADSLTGFNSSAAIDSLVTWIDTLDLTAEAASSIHSHEVSFVNYSGDGKYVVFYAFHPASQSATQYNYIYIDDITLRVIPNCFWPTEIAAVEVGSDEATIAWSPDPRTSSPSSWIVEYGPSGFTPDNGTTITVSGTDTTVTINNLLPTTAYDVYVQASCSGDISDAISITFTTSDIPADIPYFTGFESGDDTSWLFLNASQTNYWTISALDSANGNAMFITNNGTDNTYTITSTSNVFAMRTFDIDAAGEYSVSFDWRTYGESSYDYLRAFVVPNNVTITPGELNGISTTATPAGWVNVGSYNGAVKMNLSSSWQTCNATLTVGENQTGYYKLVFFWHNDASGGTMPPAAVDNIDVHLISCPAPVNLVFNTITANQIDFSWTPIGDEDMWQVKINNGTWEDVYDTSYSAVNLTPETAYTLSVRAVCGADDTSVVLGPVSVNTRMDCGEDYVNIVDTIGDGTTSGYTYFTYNYSSYAKGYSANIFTADEMADMGIMSTAEIHSVSVHAGTTGCTFANLKVYAGTIDTNCFIGATDTNRFANMTLLYDSSLTTTSGEWVTINFDSAFHYDGTSNLMLLFRRTGASTASGTFYYKTTSPVYSSIYGYASSATANPTATRTYYRVNMIFNMCAEVPSCIRPMDVNIVDLQDTTVTITWENEEGSYEYAFGPYGFDPDTASAISVLDTFAVLSGLTGNNYYDFYVRTICGSDLVSDWSIATTVHTPCSAQPLPYTENFESYGSGSTYSIDPCWVKGTNSTTAYPYPYGTNVVTGTRSLYFYAYHPSVATTAPYFSYAALPMMQAPIDTLMVSFSTRRYNSTTTYYTSRILVGVMSDPNDISTFEGVDTVDLYNELPGSVHNFEVAFNNYNGNGKFIAFYNAEPPLYGTSAYSYSYISLDDIVVDYIPTCPRVINVTVDSATQNSAVIRWSYPYSAANGYEVEYGPENFVIGTGTTITTVDTFITIAGLTASTGYDFYVRPLCSSTDVGPWSFITTFRTNCGLYTLPYAEDFESYGTGATYSIDPCWTKGTNSATAYPYPYGTNVVTGTRSLYFYAYHPSSTTSTPIYSYVALPEFNVAVDSLELSFKMRRYGTTGNSYTSRLLVGVMTDPEDISTFVGVDTIDLQAEPASSIHDIVVTFSSYTGTGNHIAIYDAVPPLYSTGTYSYSYVYIDDINVDRASPCGRPLNLQATATNNSITIDWTDTVNATQWQIEYGPTGFEIGNGTIVNTSQKPYTINGLTTTTLYDIYVRSICSDGSVGGNNSGIFTVSTTQVPATLPYYYNFENATEWSNWQTVSNNAAEWYRGTAEAAEGSYGLYLSIDSGTTCNSYHNVITNAAVYRDIDFGATPSSFEMSFLAKSAGVSDGNYEGINVMIVDPTIPVSASSTSLTSPWGSFNVVHVVRDTNWNEHTILFDNISGVKRVVFNWYTSTTVSHPVWNGAGAIDSIVVMEQECPRPLNTAVNDIGPDYVSLSWDGPANSSYVVRLRETSGTVNIDNIATTNSITVSNLSSMTSYYAWIYRICDTNSYSYSAPRIEFTTTCSLIAAVDTLYEDFDTITGTTYSTAGVLPDCWEGYSNGTSAAYWPHVTNGSTYSYSVSGNAVTLTSGSTTTYGDTKILRLPKFIEPVNTLTMSYWYCTESSSIGTLYVGYMTGFDYENDFVPVVSHPASSESYHSGNGPQPAGTGVFDTVTFDSVPSNALFIAFKWYQNGTFYSCCIDNVEVTSNGNYCPAPEVFPASDVTYNSATISWSGTASDYEVAVKASSDALWPEETALTTNSFALSGLEPSTNYQFRVRALCDTAEGLISDWVVGNFITDSLPCFAPSALQNTAVDLTTATFDWTVNGEETAWRLYVWNSTFNQSYDVTAHPATITGLTQTTDYYATVVAVCGGGIIESETSDTVSFTTATCQPVSNVAVSNVSHNAATVSWSGSAASYTLEYGQGDFETGSGTLVSDITTTSYEITGLVADRNYSVYVRADCDAQNPSAWSERIQFRTLEAEGIADVNGVNVTVYPNPTSDNTTIALSGVSGDVTITIVDLNGRTVKSDSMSCDGDCVKTLVVSGLAEGAYFVRVSGEGINMVKKLVVK